jgi:hypothetical protein
VELEHLNSAELTDLEKETTRPAARTTINEEQAPLRQLQHGLGNRALGQLIQAKFTYEGSKSSAGTHAAEAELATASNSSLNSLEAMKTSEAANSSRGEGRPLSDGERAFFEPRFKEDFGDVRLHTGGAASESARSIDARAYATGQDIIFADGHYAPHTGTGLRLMAHELAHVVQQRRPGGVGVGGASTESGAHAAAEALASGRAVSAQTIGSAAPGLYADNGFSLTPGLADSPSSFGGFKLPPLKVSRTLLLYLVNNGLMTVEMRRMLLRGEIIIEDEAAKSADKDEAPGAGIKGPLDARTQFDNFLELVTRKRTAEEEAAAQAAPTTGTSPYAEPKPMTGPLYTPDPKKRVEYKGLIEGLNFKMPYLPPMNLSVSGLTLDMVKSGQFDSKLVAGFDQSLEVQLSYRDWHLAANMDTDGKWLLKLSYPNDSPVMGSLDAVFGQGERALRETLRTFKVGPGPDHFTALKDRVSTLATPIKSAVDAAQGIAKIQPGLNVSVMVGAGPAPGKLPQSAVEGRKQPSTPFGAYAGLQFTFHL